MTTDAAAKYQKILADPAYQRLVRARKGLAWFFSGVMGVAYFTFILLIAFKPKVLAIPVVAGSPITWGLPVGLGLIILAFVMTGIYAYVANHVFDKLAHDVHKKL